MAYEAQPSFLHVLGREGNRRDAILTCALCGARVQMHFYEAPGEPELDGGLLWLFHYNSCELAKEQELIELRLMWDVAGRATENLELDPKTRRLKRGD